MLQDAVELIYVSMVRCILVVSDNELASAHLCRHHHVVRLWNQDLPVVNSSLVQVTQINHAKLSFRSIVVGHDIHLPIDDVDWRVVVIHVEGDLHEFAVRVGHITNPQGVSCTLTALVQEHVTLVISHAHAMEITRLLRIFIKELVFVLRITELMVVNLMVFVDI